MATPQKSILLDWLGGSFPALQLGKLPPSITVNQEDWQSSVTAVITTVLVSVGYDVISTAISETNDLQGRVDVNIGITYNIPYTAAGSTIL